MRKTRIATAAGCDCPGEEEEEQPEEESEENGELGKLVIN